MRRPKGPKNGVTMFTKGGLRRLYAYISPEVYEDLRRLAFERKTSISALAAEAIAEYLESPRAKPPKK